MIIFIYLYKNSNIPSEYKTTHLFIEEGKYNWVPEFNQGENNEKTKYRVSIKAMNIAGKLTIELKDSKSLMGENGRYT